MKKRLVQALKTTLSLFLLMMLAAIVGDLVYGPTKTNRMYLQEVLESHSNDKLAAAVDDELRKNQHENNLTEADLKNIRKGLIECLIKEERKYLVSSDPYLNEKVNMKSPKILAARFLKSCGALN